MADAKASSVWCFSLIIILSSEFMFLQTVKLGSCQSRNLSCIAVERKALLRFKDGLTDPSDRLSSWRGKDCCSWSGVHCSDKLGHVTKLKLPNLSSSNPDVLDATAYALGGELNPSLLDLKHLNYLDLSFNDFGGVPIPNFIGSLKTLRYLNLSGASFGGTLPSFLGNLTSLRYLDLNSCFGDSNENDLHWLSTLSHLKHLNLGSIDLTMASTYWLQAVNMLPSLEELHLPASGLTLLHFSLPFVNLSSLSVLDLSNNGFNSSIPSWLFNMTGLRYLDLNSNNLRGEIPDGFANLKLLRYLDLSKNPFIQGKLSRRNLGSLCNLQVLDLSVNSLIDDISEFTGGLSLCNNCSLESLHLGYNQLSGFLPDSLGGLRNLRTLLLMENSFAGSIPESISNLSSLELLDLSDNGMKGTIPSSIGQLSSLVSLQINHNQWEGVITEAHFSNLTSLKELSIDQSSINTTLIFDVTSNWIPPFKLNYMELKSCFVGPGFPKWLRNQNELHFLAVWNAGIVGNIPEWFWKLDLVLDQLDLSHNQLTGKIPNSIKFNPQGILYLNYNNFMGPMPVLSSNLTSFHLDHNMFSGPIPHDIGEQMPMLTELDVSVNSLNGSIPSSIQNLISLYSFAVSDNQLTGEIPDIWKNTPDLWLIDLSSNRLSGKIPNSFGSLSALKFLRLSRNNLSGEIPLELQNCTSIQNLDLGDNRLSGEIPTWIGESLSSLLVLNLQSNLFTGYIPRQLCSLSLLHLLDFGENSLSGSIPRCFGKMSGFSSYVNTSSRYEAQLWVAAKGTDYLYSGSLFLVNSLNLASNNLSGEFPEELANLTRLGTLNLSMNHLKGEIPSGIGRLQWLETLDLSSNRFSGMIPSSMASMTFLNHLNLSHNDLFGKIPSANQFQTFTDPSIYEGNNGLCGFPLTNKCSGDNDELPESGEEDEDGDGDDGPMVWFYVSMGLGFVVGFWGVCGTLIVKKSWRRVYFKFVDDMKERLMLFVLLKLARLRRLKRSMKKEETQA